MRGVVHSDGKVPTKTTCWARVSRVCLSAYHQKYI